MPAPGVALEKLGFLTIGTFDGDDPRPGHEHLLAEIELAEQLGFDSVWLRHRHLQYGMSSPVTVLAAASQRTSRIEFGTAEEIAEALYAHAGFRESRECVFALPFTFAREDYVQILADMATKLGPALGWSASPGA